MTTEQDEILHWIRRQAVVDTLHRYASCLDQFDSEGLREVFADEAEFRSVPVLDDRPDDGTPKPAVVVRGADGIVRFIEAMSAPVRWQHHLLSVFDVHIEGARASALTYMISHKTFIESSDQVTVVVARYRDQLTSVDGRWVITEKVMDVGWMEVRTAQQSTFIEAYARRAGGASAATDPLQPTYR